MTETIKKCALYFLFAAIFALGLIFATGNMKGFKRPHGDGEPAAVGPGSGLAR
jgi:hypothetical protein